MLFLATAAHSQQPVTPPMPDQAPREEPPQVELQVAIPVPEHDRDWSNTLERVATGVVSIRVDSTRAFDTEWNSSSQATGFVVDAEHGIILTNRHVVTPGPVAALLETEAGHVIPPRRRRVRRRACSCNRRSSR
jgi:S1-C subfamily serine protease